MNIKIETEIGDIDLVLDSNNAPKTSEYFVGLLERNKLDNTSFFRIVAPDSLAPAVSSVPIAVVQFGHWEELSGNLTQIDHETTKQTGLHHTKWSLSTARYGPGQVYGSFFVCMRDEASFDFGGDRHPDGAGFAKFGEVTSGFSVLEQIFNDRSPQEFQQNPIQILRIRES